MCVRVCVCVSEVVEEVRMILSCLCEILWRSLPVARHGPSSCDAGELNRAEGQAKVQVAVRSLFAK